MSKRTRTTISIVMISAIALSAFLSYEIRLGKQLLAAYARQRSTAVYDRHGEMISIRPNDSGYYSTFSDVLPENIKEKIIKQEDRYFRYHPGVNPISMARSVIGRWQNKKIGGSTITQQMAKILLRQENSRGWKNKMREIFYSFGLEMVTTKDDLLLMYANSIYFGNSAQGISEASRLYFDKLPSMLDDDEISLLLKTISSPSTANPLSGSSGQKIKQAKEVFNGSHGGSSSFELDTFSLPTDRDMRLTLDQGLSSELRKIAKKNIQSLIDKNTVNAAIVVLREPSNEVLAIIGSPDPSIPDYGYQINMAKEMRPIGSTIKPLLYLKGFEKRLRPYTLVDDREYKYIINDGFSFYPKNYDYAYHGIVSLHYSLSNSLNVPSVKVLEYIGIDDFNDWLTNDLRLRPQQDIETYQLGIALGGLEMDLLSLTYYNSILTNGGRLTPLYVDTDHTITPPRLAADFRADRKISDEKYVELINKILSDRLTGVEQFGLNSSLNLPSPDYAVKTGTSRDYHDSWTVGYTPDFIVGVWVGNSDNTAMDRVSGQIGAGKIWNEAMSLMLNSKYNLRSKFTSKDLKTFPSESGIDYGLPSDDYEKSKNLLTDDRLILQPHDNDIYSISNDTKIILKSTEQVAWLLDGQDVGHGNEQIYEPKDAGSHTITAKTRGREETITIFLKKEDE